MHELHRVRIPPDLLVHHVHGQHRRGHRRVGEERGHHSLHHVRPHHRLVALDADHYVIIPRLIDAEDVCLGYPIQRSHVMVSGHDARNSDAVCETPDLLVACRQDQIVPGLIHQRTTNHVLHHGQPEDRIEGLSGKPRSRHPGGNDTDDAGAAVPSEHPAPSTHRGVR